MQPRRYKERVVEQRSGADGDPETRADAGSSPRVVGPFELLRELGSGSSGTVSEARLLADYGDLAAGEHVAVKFLRPELHDDDGAQRRLLEEGALGMSVRHPNVAEIYGVEETERAGDGARCLVMQFVQGTTLRELLDRGGAVLEDLARRVGADAARGLFALHRRGLVHRDVKPENLILTPDSELKIVDLGLARPFDADDADAAAASATAKNSSGYGLAGSLAYASPERLRGEPAGPRSDLYALGVVLYEVVTGRHPFAYAKTPDEMMDAHLRTVPQRPSQLRPRLSPLLDQVLLALLQKDPEDRPRSAAELVRILELGERSDYWRRSEAEAPVLASTRRLMRMRRPAEAPFVGRRRESGALDRAFAAARRGRGRALAVVAAESSGRRRLLDEAMLRWLQEDAPPRYVGGEADRGLGHGEPFAGSLLDLLLRGDDAHSPNARARAVARARERFGLSEGDAEALVATVFGDSTETPEVRADRIAAALLSLPQPSRPLVVRIDRADELGTSGRLVLQQLLTAAPTTHLLVLLAAGPDTEIVEPSAQLELSGLDEASFASFGRSLFRSPVSPEVDAYLRDAHQLLSGLPGSLLEALDHLAEEGQLRGRVGDYHDLARDAEPAPAPSHVERFRRRVERLEPAHRATLSAAAVLGDRCRLSELAALILSPELAVLETLSLFRGRIVNARGGEVAFRHRAFRRALLRQLPPDELQRLHAAAAAVLEARGASALVVGMHRSQAFDHAGCLEPLLEALEARVQAGSRRTALRLVGRLAVHFRHVPSDARSERLRLRFLLLRGRAQQDAGQFEAAARAYRSAEQLARRIGDLGASAAARTGLAEDALQHGRMLAAVTLLETVHGDLDGDRPPHAPAADSVAARAHALHGRILLYLGQAADCIKHLLAARKRVPPDDEDLRCHLWIDVARAEGLARRYGTAARTLAAIERSDPVRRLPRARLRFHLYRGQLRATMGDPDAGQDLRLARDEAQRLGLPVYGGRAALFLGERAFHRGRDEEAAQHFELAQALAGSASDEVGAAAARCHLVRLGRRDESLRGALEDLALPQLQASWLLAAAGCGRAGAEEAAELDALLEAVDLPLSLHLRALTWLDRPASARSLVHAVSQRLQQRSQRQRFRKYWGGHVRV